MEARWFCQDLQTACGEACVPRNKLSQPIKEPKPVDSGEWTWASQSWGPFEMTSSSSQQLNYYFIRPIKNHLAKPFPGIQIIFVAQLLRFGLICYSVAEPIASLDLYLVWNFSSLPIKLGFCPTRTVNRLQARTIYLLCNFFPFSSTVFTNVKSSKIFYQKEV